MFAIVGLVPLAFGGSFLEHSFFHDEWGIKTKWGLEAIEVAGVGPIVAGIVVGLFFLIAAGSKPTDSGAGAVDDDD
jgi:multicomponent Na+:H+ antiporter subunit B